MVIKTLREFIGAVCGREKMEYEHLVTSIDATISSSTGREVLRTAAFTRAFEAREPLPDTRERDTNHRG